MADAEITMKPLTIDEIEAANMYEDDGRIPHVPFGFASGEWQRFKAAMRPGDRIYEFSSSPESWAALAGWCGYVLVQDGKPVDRITTVIS